MIILFGLMFRLAYVSHAICSSNFVKNNASNFESKHTISNFNTQAYNTCMNDINEIIPVENNRKTHIFFTNNPKNNIHVNEHELNADYDHKFCKNKNEPINNKIDYRHNHLDCNIQAMIGQNGDNCRTLKNNDKTGDSAIIDNDLYSRYLADDEYLKHEYDVMTMIYNPSNSLKFVDSYVNYNCDYQTQINNSSNENKLYCDLDDHNEILKNNRNNIEAYIASYELKVINAILKSLLRYFVILISNKKKEFTNLELIIKDIFNIKQENKSIQIYLFNLIGRYFKEIPSNILKYVEKYTSESFKNFVASIHNVHDSEVVYNIENIVELAAIKINLKINTNSFNMLIAEIAKTTVQNMLFYRLNLYKNLQYQ